MLTWHNAESLAWEGRKLKIFTKPDETIISYTYNDSGIRTSKTVNNEKVEYILDGTKIIREIRDDYTLTFLYDDGTLVGFNYDNETSNADYYFWKKIEMNDYTVIYEAGSLFIPTGFIILAIIDIQMW